MQNPRYTVRRVTRKTRAGRGPRPRAAPGWRGPAEDSAAGADSPEPEGGPPFMDIDAWPATTLRRELALRGLHFPPPEKLADAELLQALWRLIHCLAELHVFLHSTDHLSNRELYTRLWHQELAAATWLPLQHQPEALHIDLIGSGSEEDVELYLRFYAGPDERAWWAHEFPDIPIPPATPCPHDRDRLLPSDELLGLRFMRSA